MTNGEQTMTRMRRQGGLTLVELMIALVLGSILMVGVVQLFSNMRHAYTLNESLSRIQEAGRFGMEHMSRHMRMAGYLGCERVPPNLMFHGDTEDSKDDLMYRFNVPIEGYDYNGTGRLNPAGFEIAALEPDGSTDTSQWSPALDADLSGDVVPGTDVFAVRYMDSGGVEAMQPGDNGGPSSPPTFNGDHKFKQGDTILISDCSGRAVSGDVGSASTSQITLGSGQFPQMGNPVNINQARSDVFYIGVGGNGNPALFRRTLANESNVETQELVNGVESMQILYGVDSNGNGRANEYMDAGEVAAADEWPNVLSARLSMLVRGHRNINELPDRDTINVMGVPFTLAAGEDRQRRVFTTTVQFRNRARN